MGAGQGAKDCASGKAIRIVETAERISPSSMILIGQYDSSFVRRVAIALRLYDPSSIGPGRSLPMPKGWRPSIR